MKHILSHGRLYCSASNETSSLSFGHGQYTMDNLTPFKRSSQLGNDNWLVSAVRLTHINLSKHSETYRSGKCLCHCLRTGSSISGITSDVKVTICLDGKKKIIISISCIWCLQFKHHVSICCK